MPRGQAYLHLLPKARSWDSIPSYPDTKIKSFALIACEYGTTLCAAAERDHVWGTQFHPEKSGTTGLGLLANFVERCSARLGESAL